MKQAENIRNILFRRLKHFGLEKQAIAARVCAVAKDAAKGDFEIISFKNGTLKIRVESPAKAHLVRLSQNKIIAKINQKLGQELVKKIRFEIEN